MLLRVSERSDIEEEGASRRVRVRLPPWLGGNDILQPVGEAELKATPVDASTFWWQLEAACATALSLFVSTSGEGPPIAGAHTAAATTWWVAQMNSSCRKSATSPTIAMPMGRSCRVGCSRRS